MIIAGVDEAGRGPLYGAVVAAAVILPPNHGIPGITDSKKLSASKREAVAELIMARASAWSVASSSSTEIDELNILQATLLAMQRAVAGLSIQPDKVLIDGNHAPKLNVTVETVIGGDNKYEQIAAASILAKVKRDSMLLETDLAHPEYGFAKHKGYGTRAHLQAIRQFGVLPEHRRSFSPVARALEAELV